MSTDTDRDRRDLRSYIVGLVLALLLTGAAFAAVLWHVASPRARMAIVYGLGLIQIVVHFRFFLHVDLGRSSRPKLLLILFSALITLLMVAGTLVILMNLHHRMM